MLTYKLLITNRRIMNYGLLYYLQLNTYRHFNDDDNRSISERTIFFLHNLTLMCHYTKKFTLICTSDYYTFCISKKKFSHTWPITIVYILRNTNLFRSIIQWTINIHNTYKQHSTYCWLWWNSRCPDDALLL